MHDVYNIINIAQFINIAKFINIAEFIKIAQNDIYKAKHVKVKNGC